MVEERVLLGLPEYEGVDVVNVLLPKQNPCVLTSLSSHPPMAFRCSHACAAVHTVLANCCFLFRWDTAWRGGVLLGALDSRCERAAMEAHQYAHQLGVRRHRAAAVSVPARREVWVSREEWLDGGIDMRDPASFATADNLHMKLFWYLQAELGLVVELPVKERKAKSKKPKEHRRAMRRTMDKVLCERSDSQLHYSKGSMTYGTNLSASEHSGGPAKINPVLSDDPSCHWLGAHAQLRLHLRVRVRRGHLRLAWQAQVRLERKIV